MTPEFKARMERHCGPLNWAENNTVQTLVYCAAALARSVERADDVADELVATARSWTDEYVTDLATRLKHALGLSRNSDAQDVADARLSGLASQVELARVRSNLVIAELALVHIIIQGHADHCGWAKNGCTCHLKIAAIALDLVPEIDKAEPKRERIEAALAARRGDR